MIASVCLEQKLIQPSLQKTSKDIWGFTCQTPFVSEFLLQRRGWHVCKHPWWAPSTFPSPLAGSCSSHTLWARLWEVIWVFLPEKEGNALWGACSYAFWPSGFQGSSLLSWWLHSGGWGWHSVLSPFPRAGLGGLAGAQHGTHTRLPSLALGGGCMSWALLLPLPLLVFTFLIWCVCLAPPWLAHGKLLQFGNPGQGEISFLESGSWPPFPASVPVQGRGCTCAPTARSSPALLTPGPALPPCLHCSLLPCRFPPASFWVCSSLFIFPLQSAPPREGMSFS